jgi:hypothetical protein
MSYRNLMTRDQREDVENGRQAYDAFLVAQCITFNTP